MTIPQFVSARQKFREGLGSHDAALIAQIRRIDDVLWDRPFTAAEKQTRAKLVEDLAVIRREQFFLAEADIREFDQQPRIRELRDHFANLKTDLEQRQAALERLVGRITTATRLIGALEKVLQQLAKLII
jgi:hypothetical protein